VQWDDPTFVVFVFDVTDPESLESCLTWAEKIKASTGASLPKGRFHHETAEGPNHACNVLMAPAIQLCFLHPRFFFSPFYPAISWHAFPFPPFSSVSRLFLKPL